MSGTVTSARHDVTEPDDRKVLEPELSARRFELVAERVLPSVDGFPSASEIGVGSYLERFAKEPSFDAISVDLRQALELVEDLLSEMFGVGLSASSPEQRDAVLQRFADIPIPSIRRRFQLLVQVSIAGYFCHPIHGGNRNGDGWKAFGIRIDRRPVSKGSHHG